MHAGRRILAGALALGAIGALAGCTSSPVGATVSAAPTRAASAAPTPAPTITTPPPTPKPSGATAVRIPCSTLVPPAIVQGIAKGYTARPGWQPTALSPVAHLAALDGTVCAWKDPSDGHLLEVGVAEPSKADAEALKNDLVERSNSVPTYREEAYFQVTSGTGEVNDFHGPFWIVASSKDLFEPGDAADLITSVDTALDAAATTN